MSALLKESSFEAAGLDLTHQTCSKPWVYANAMLLKVSRTFALNIGILSPDVRRPVLLAYLFCRIADTLEDDAFLETDKKVQLLQEFSELFDVESNWRDRVQAFQANLPESWSEGPDYDQVLTYWCQWPFELYFNFGDKDRAVLKKWIQEMCEGMKLYSRRRDEGEGWFILEDLADLDRYCYYVAGTVGYLLCDLFLHHSLWIGAERYKALSSKANSFGLGLQITNIVKDQCEDWHRKTSFVPRSILEVQNLKLVSLVAADPQDLRAALKPLIRKALDHLRDAKDYTILLPRLEAKMRLFCLWPLFMALATLEKVAMSVPFAQERIKISREEVQQIIKTSSSKVFFNGGIEKLFQAYESRILKALEEV
jgi:farnesyl-diphosphate farnesyltransferase